MLEPFDDDEHRFNPDQISLQEVARKVRSLIVFYRGIDKRLQLIERLQLQIKTVLITLLVAVIAVGSGLKEGLLLLLNGFK